MESQCAFFGGKFCKCIIPLDEHCTYFMELENFEQNNLHSEERRISATEKPDVAE